MSDLKNIQYQGCLPPVDKVVGYRCASDVKIEWSVAKRNAMKWLFGLMVFSITVGISPLRPLAGEATVRPELEVRTVTPNTLSVIAWCSAERKGRFRYALITKKTGHAGNATTRQTGIFNLTTEIRAELCNLKYTIQPEDQFHFTLKIFADETVVAEINREFQAI
jgi:hypothetical protein